jgi:hypothetical protein
VLIVHASTVDKTDDVKDGFYRELESVFDNFPNYHMKILLEVSIPKYTENTLLNRQLGTNVYKKRVMIKELG